MNVETENCSPLTVTNGTVAAYPTCTITCNSGYDLSGSTCVAESHSGGGSSSNKPATTTVVTSGGGGLATSTGYQFTRDLGVGSTGADVVELQKILVAGGYLVMPAGVPMGTYGGLTVAAVRAYQRANGLSPVGVVGPQTRAKLNSRGGSSVTNFVNLLIQLGIIAPDKVPLVKVLLGL